MFIYGDQAFLLPLKGQANLNVQALEERLKKLEGKSETDSVGLALQALHRTLDKTHFDPEDAVLDLESLVKVAKIRITPKRGNMSVFWMRCKNTPSPCIRSLCEICWSHLLVTR